MKRYYGIIDEDGFLSDTGTNAKEIRKTAKMWGDGCQVVNLSEEVFQYAREEAGDEPLHIDELDLEYDSEINDAVYYLKLRNITVGDLKKAFKNLPDDTEISIWDPDSRSSKSCVDFFMNGPFLDLKAETWGRSYLKEVD